MHVKTRANSSSVYLNGDAVEGGGAQYDIFTTVPVVWSNNIGTGTVSLDVHWQ
jgi:hypothetical protein